MNDKHKCECGKLATWCYMPSCDFYPFYCDDCVSRGCDCNTNYVKTEHGNQIFYDYPPTEIPDKTWKWVDEGDSWIRIDELGREYPCCEFFYEKEGWDINE